MHEKYTNRILSSLAQAVAFLSRTEIEDIFFRIGVPKEFIEGLNKRDLTGSVIRNLSEGNFEHQALLDGIIVEAFNEIQNFPASLVSNLCELQTHARKEYGPL